MIFFVLLLIFCIEIVNASSAPLEQHPESSGSPRTGCIGEFATFGFLTFMITLLQTILNMVTTVNIVNNNNNNNNNDNNNNNNNDNNNNNNMNMGGRELSSSSTSDHCSDPWSWPWILVNALDQQFKMLDRVVRKVYPKCHQSLQCRLVDQVEGIWQGLNFS